MNALPPAARLAAAGLRTLSRASLPCLLVALLRANDPPLTPDVLARALLALVLLPELSARLVLRAFASDARIESGVLRVAGGLRSLEIPCSAIQRASAWRLPLPSAGISLRLRSGARFAVGLAAPDLSGPLAGLARAGVATPAPGDPALAWAGARVACPRRWWNHALAKIGAASLVPAAIAFNAHQHIAFGGLLGESYLMGPGAWLASAGRYWLASALYLVLWAGCFRIAVETTTWVAAWIAPERAARMRRASEGTASLLYYASIPSLLALRFLA